MSHFASDVERGRSGNFQDVTRTHMKLVASKLNRVANGDMLPSVCYATLRHAFTETCDCRDRCKFSPPGNAPDSAAAEKFALKFAELSRATPLGILTRHSNDGYLLPHNTAALIEPPQSVSRMHQKIY